jgi:hypothetical protein
MATLTKGELLEIAYAATEPAVSIFMPTHHAGAAEIRQDPIRLNNLLNEAETRLTGRGLRRPDAEALLEPAAELIDSPDFWQHRSEGLALYLARGFMRFIDLPYQPEERLSIGPNFRLRPLLGLFERSERYTVVSVSFAGARVFTADRERLAERTDLSLPQGIREIMAETDYQRMTNAAPTLRLRSASPGSVSGKHGFGEAPEELRKAELIEYLHRLDAALLPVLSNRHEPVIIVGDPQVSGHFHSLSKLPNLHSEALEVNAEALPLAELHRRTMLLAEPTFGRAKQSALEHLRTLHGSADARAIVEVADIVKAARYARVDTLFLPESGEVWGVFDEARDQVLVHNAPEAGDVELMDQAATHTLSNGGSVFTLRREDLPLGARAAAVLRY